MAKTITITSGQAGVGKTSIAINLALNLAREGKRVCLFEADPGLQDIQSLLGTHADGSFMDASGIRRSLGDILLCDFHGVDLLQGSHAMEFLSGHEDGPTRSNDSVCFKPTQEYDYFLIDATAGLSQSSLAFCLASTEIIFVVTPEPESLTSTYAMIRMVRMNGYPGELNAIVNRCADIDAGRQAYSTLHKVTNSYLEVNIPLLGLVFEDPELARCGEMQQAVNLSAPESVASRCIKDMARRLIEEHSAPAHSEKLRTFWSRLLWLLDCPQILPRTSGAKEVRQASAPKVSVADSSALIEDTIPIADQMVATLAVWLARAKEWQSALQGSAGKKSVFGRKLPGVASGAATMAKVLRNYAYKKQQVGYREASMDVYHVNREGDRGSVSCAYHGPDGHQKEPGNETTVHESGHEQQK